VATNFIFKWDDRGSSLDPYIYNAIVSPIELSSQDVKYLIFINCPSKISYYNVDIILLTKPTNNW
jgi:hypothetical protein